MDYFAHSALANRDSIRIATILPGRGDEDIKITLSQIDLRGEMFEFEALSYVWGDSTDRRPIICHDKMFYVTRGLHRALRFLRRETSPRLLWIDAICIHQKDLAERNQQVGHMKSIYSRASQVIIWVGENVQDAQAGANMCRLALDLGKADRNFFNQTPEARRKMRDSLNRQSQFRNLLRDGLRFLQNEWFRRVWTFQEVYVSKEAMVQCREFTFPWKMFCFAWQMLDLLGIKDYSAEHTSAITVMATYLWHKEMEFEGMQDPRQLIRLSNLARSSRRHVATDPRDKLFGLLAMIEPQNGIQFPIDYRLSVEEVYTSYAKLMIQDDGHLQILSDVDRSHSDYVLPSWVPCWTKGTRQALAERIRDFPLLYRLHGEYEAKLVIPQTTDPEKLYLRGSCIDRVLRTAILKPLIDEFELPTQLTPESWHTTLIRFRHFFEGLGFTPEIYSPTAEAGVSAAIRTLAADDLPTSNRGSEETIREFFPWYFDLKGATWEESIHPEIFDVKTTIPSLHRYKTGAPVHEVYDYLFGRGTYTIWGSSPSVCRRHIDNVYYNLTREILQKIRMMSRDRKFFITDKGYLGIGPQELQEGDLVFDLLGGDVPYVLRPAANSNEYSLLGDSYMHGIMDGELWKRSVDGDGLESVHGDLTWIDVILV